jgi:hypothetical protein
MFLIAPAAVFGGGDAAESKRITRFKKSKTIRVLRESRLFSVVY